ncbi:hypothetical protein KOR42_39330 [Thalassoglobus neptunius]|uniref:Uncharacterized protein n=1 Tax=Thalassoglobus neptunius TaxID=1938619 RepID=A0A5C5WES7_9PLAN|nr:hypothetical protein [Thalassoglobus neptunius]TWT49017.1 hypothetical protein KOR42_39330 [Thalassoglobus neptunius]
MTQPQLQQYPEHVPRPAVPRRMDPQQKANRSRKIGRILASLAPEDLDSGDPQDLYDRICLEEITPHEFAQQLEHLRGLRKNLATGVDAGSPSDAADSSDLARMADTVEIDDASNPPVDEAELAIDEPEPAVFETKPSDPETELPIDETVDEEPAAE